MKIFSRLSDCACRSSFHRLKHDHLPRRLLNIDPSAEPWRPIEPLYKRLHLLPNIYGTLSKLRLSALVVATTMAGFEVAPSIMTSTNSFTTLGWTIVGVALSSFSANSFNQWLESPFDSQMGRTKTRPLPTMRLSGLHAFSFATVTGILGVGTLALQVGGLAATLAGTNILLYAALYTPLKRTSIANTWVGAVVGAIPPMIGFVAAEGGALTLGCLTLGAILYCWQFPHFNSLSWNLRQDYARAGYCMASVMNPKLTVNTALRHSVALIPLSALLVYSQVCDQYFLLDSTMLNVVLIYLTCQFRKKPERKTARTLFFFSLLHLPILLGLMIFHRKRNLMNPSS